MTTISGPISLEQRSLARRIERYLNAIEREGKVLGPWETDILCRVFALIETDLCAVGKDLMVRLEYPDRYGTPDVRAAVADGPKLTVTEQRANLARVLGRY